MLSRKGGKGAIQVIFGRGRWERGGVLPDSFGVNNPARPRAPTPCPPPDRLADLQLFLWDEDPPVRPGGVGEESAEGGFERAFVLGAALAVLW
jgi:hypothetical protein